MRNKKPKKRDNKEQLPEGLDRLDVRLLDLLQADVTLPVAELAERLHSSKSVIWRRIQRYLDEGIITSRVALLDPQKVGLPLLVFAHVKLSRHEAGVLQRFLDAVGKFPQVVECHTLLGEVDFLLKIVARDLADYENFFWHQLSRLDGVQGVNSSVSLSRFVNTTRLPLPV